MTAGRRLHPAPGTVVLLLTYPAIATLGILAFRGLGGKALLDDPDFVATNLALLLTAPWLIAIPIYLSLGGWLSGLSTDDMGLRRPLRWRWLGAGLVDGVLLILIPAGFAVLLGGYTLLNVDTAAGIEAKTGLAALPRLPTLCAAILTAAFGEELLCRGLLLRYWQPVLGSRSAIILSSLLFTAMHVANENLSVFGILGIFLAGMLLGTVYVGSSSLLLVTGLHAGWNLSTSILVGLPVSGMNLPSLARLEVSNSPLARRLLGGDFGPEEGLAYQAFLLALAASVLLKRRSAVGRQ